MRPRSLDLDRLRKCAALMLRGATAGERAAGEAAAARVAAAAGLSLEEALRRGESPSGHREARRPSPRRPEPEPRAKPEAAVRTGPITVEELRAEKARHQDWLKRKAAREERRLRTVYAEQEAANAILREEQARRDREWAGTRARKTRARKTTDP